MGVTKLIFELYWLKLKLALVFFFFLQLLLLLHMVTYAEKMTMTCLPKIMHLFCSSAPHAKGACMWSTMGKNMWEPIDARNFGFGYNCHFLSIYMQHYRTTNVYGTLGGWYQFPSLSIKYFPVLGWINTCTTFPYQLIKQ